MGPIRYLTLRRMQLVRRALRHSDPSTTTVTRIVSDHGFCELGRFSVAYRTMFGGRHRRHCDSPPGRPDCSLVAESRHAYLAINRASWADQDTNLVLNDFGGQTADIARRLMRGGELHRGAGSS